MGCPTDSIKCYLCVGDTFREDLIQDWGFVREYIHPEEEDPGMSFMIPWICIEHQVRLPSYKESEETLNMTLVCGVGEKGRPKVNAN